MYAWLMKQLAKIRFEWLVKLFKKPSYLDENQKRAIKRILAKNNCIVLTFDPYALSSWFVVISNWILTGKKTKYSHALINFEKEIPKSYEDFKFIESTSIGVKEADFNKIFNHSSRAALIVPTYVSQDEFESCLYDAHDLLNRPYDFSFNDKDSSKVTCVEVVLYCLKKLPFYKDNFRCLEFIRQYEDNLTPQMFASNPDFKTIFEAESL